MQSNVLLNFYLVSLDKSSLVKRPKQTMISGLFFCLEFTEIQDNPKHLLTMPNVAKPWPLYRIPDDLRDNKRLQDSSSSKPQFQNLSVILTTDPLTVSISLVLLLH